MPPTPEALNCYHGSAVRPRVIDGGARHSLLACRELREAARYLLFGDADPVDVLPLEIERDRVYRLLLEKRAISAASRIMPVAFCAIRIGCIANQPSCECQLAMRSRQ
jgi:hypothetical protein